MSYSNCVDSDKMPHLAASDLGLHCLPMSPLWSTRYQWVNTCILNSLTRKKQTTKFSSANFQKKIISPSYIILRIQRLEGK